MGHFTTLSAEYPELFCKRFAEQLSLAPSYLNLLHSTLPYVAPDRHTRRVSSLALTRHWPDVPLLYLAGELDAERRLNVVFHDSDDDTPRVAPLLADTLTDKDKAAELEEEFKWICEWLVKQKIRATRVEHRNYANGGESYLVHFEKPIIDWRDFREKSSMTFTAFGDNHRRHFGDERARAMAYAAYTASHIGTEQPRRFGVGPLKSNGFHGNLSGEFWVYKDMHEFVNNPNVDYTSETFASRSLFCWNSIVVGEHDTYIHCRCLGHSPNAEGGSFFSREITYADHSHGLVRSNAESTLLAVKKEVADVPGPVLPNGHLLTVGFVAPAASRGSASGSEPT